MLLNLAPPHNSTLPDAAMDEYAALGKFTRACYGEGAVPAPSILAHSSCYHSKNKEKAAPMANMTNADCASVVLTATTRASTMTFDRLLLKEELSGGQRVTAFSILADGKSVFDGSTIQWYVQKKTVACQHATQYYYYYYYSKFVLSSRSWSEEAVVLIAVHEQVPERVLRAELGLRARVVGKFRHDIVVAFPSPPSSSGTVPALPYVFGPRNGHRGRV